MAIEILPLEPEELKRIRSRLVLLNFLLLVFVCPLYILLIYEGMSSLIYIVRTGFQLTDSLLIAFLIIFNYLIFTYALPFYRVAADDSKLKTKHVIRTIILKVEEEFVSDMGT